MLVFQGDAWVHARETDLMLAEESSVTGVFLRVSPELFTSLRCAQPLATHS